MSFSKEEMQEFDVLCVFGGNTLPFSLEEKRVVYFHPSGGVSLDSIYFDGSVCDYHQFEALCKEEVFRSFGYFIDPLLGESLARGAEEVITKCQQVQWQTHLLAGEQKEFGLQAFKNLCRQQELGVCDFSAFKGALQGVPAIICGAGPSLAKELQVLKDKSDKAIIFAGGASLGVLTKAGVPCHITGGVDPDPSWQRVKMEGSFEAPFFCQGRFSSDILHQVQGNALLVPSNPAYPLDVWLQGGETFDGGWTVSTFLTSLATYMGCSPVIFAGMDLSYESAPYALEEEKRLLPGEIHWKGVRTKKDWVLSARFLEEVIASHPHARFYNSSSGLEIEGATEASLSYLLEEELVKTYDVLGLVHTIPIGAQKESHKHKFEELKESIDRSLASLKALVALFEKHYPQSPEDKGEFVLHQLDLEEESAYQLILAKAWEVWRYPLSREFKEHYSLRLNQLLLFEKILLDYRAAL